LRLHFSGKPVIRSLGIGERDLDFMQTTLVNCYHFVSIVAEGVMTRADPDKLTGNDGGKQVYLVPLFLIFFAKPATQPYAGGPGMSIVFTDRCKFSRSKR
jgi:hypothetical protein